MNPQKDTLAKFIDSKEDLPMLIGPLRPVLLCSIYTSSEQSMEFFGLFTQEANKTPIDPRCLLQLSAIFEMAMDKSPGVIAKRRASGCKEFSIGIKTNRWKLCHITHYACVCLK